MALTSKYGKKKIEKVISLLKDNKAVEDIICILEKSKNVLELDDSKSKSDDIKMYSLDMSESIDSITRINKLLNDKKIFKSLKDLDALIKVFIKDGINVSKRSEKIKNFNFYMKQMDEIKLKEILVEIENYNIERKEKVTAYRK